MAERFALALCAALVPGLACAEGFAVSDLGTLDVETAVFEGGTYAARATDPDRLTIMCTDCDDMVAIDVLLGESTDGTEGRVRSGETKIEDMEAMCKARDPSCTLTGVSVGPAIGWVSVYDGMIPGSTTVLFRDGDLLTIRSIAPDRETAAANGALVRETLAPQIVGSD